MVGDDPLNDRGQVAPYPSDEEGRLRILLEAVTDYAIYLIDAAGIVSSWNRGAERLKGYHRDEIVGRHFSQFYTEEDRRSGLPQRALATAEREGRFEAEGWRVRKDGERFWAHVIIDAVRDPQGRLQGFAKITRDLTERRKAEEALRESEERFRLLVQGVTDYAIYMLDPTGHVTNWNAGAHRIKGYEADEIVGQHFSRFYTPEDREAGLPAVALETARREGRFEKEGWRVCKDGTRFWASVIIDPIRNDQSKLIGFAKITRDITERRDAQLALEKAREAAFQSQKMEALGQLTGGIAHDFNNLLTAVLGSLEMLRKRLPADDPKLLQLADNAISGAERGAVLTQRMLAFARRQELSVEPIDIADLVRGLGDLLQRTIGPSVKVEMNLQEALRPANADANQLELAILNLAVNSRDAMPKGGTITVDVSGQTVGPGEPGLTPGDYIRVSVTDNGEGMDEETLARATEPFFTTKGVGRGTGLGLSTVHGLVEQLSGALRMRSRKGEGTTVELWLPAAEGKAVSMQALRRSEPDTEPAHERCLTVLAVDDDGLVLMNTAAMLEELGHKVLEAASGAHALAIVRRHPDIDLVVTDYAMPGMTGADLVEAIHEERPGLPVVLATGYAELPQGAEVAATRLPKPFGQIELQRAVNAATREREPVRA